MWPVLRGYNVEWQIGILDDFNRTSIRQLKARKIIGYVWSIRTKCNHRYRSDIRTMSVYLICFLSPSFAATAAADAHHHPWHHHDSAADDRTRSNQCTIHTPLLSTTAKVYDCTTAMQCVYKLPRYLRYDGRRNEVDVWCAASSTNSFVCQAYLRGEHINMNSVVWGGQQRHSSCMSLRVVGRTQHKHTGNLFFSFKTNARRASLADDLSIVLTCACVMYVHM